VGWGDRVGHRKTECDDVLEDDAGFWGKLPLLNFRVHRTRSHNFPRFPTIGGKAVGIDLRR
jgi:hypothetical protein